MAWHTAWWAGLAVAALATGPASRQSGDSLLRVPPAPAAQADPADPAVVAATAELACRRRHSAYSPPRMRARVRRAAESAANPEGRRHAR